MTLPVLLAVVVALAATPDAPAGKGGPAPAPAAAAAPAAAPAPGPAAPTAPALPSGLRALSRIEDVRDLCMKLRPSERVVFEGQSKASARDQFEKERSQLIKADYVVELPWKGFAVADWDPEDGVVTLTTERPFRAFDEALALFDVDREKVELDAVPGAAEELKAALSKALATLVLVFRPADEEGNPCVMGKAKTFTFAVDLISAELKVNGRTVAKASRDGFLPMGATQGEPRVEVRASADCADCSAEVAASVAKVTPALEKCFREALARKPALDGSLVLSLEVGKDGRAGVSTVVADSLQEPGAVDCVRGAVGTARSATKGGKGMVVVDFERR